jgi:FtsP/CotA-like multicopper oxidase with cupredoxin domain
VLRINTDPTATEQLMNDEIARRATAPTTRREFMRVSALGLAIPAGLAACDTNAGNAATAKPVATASHAGTTPTAATTTPAAAAGNTADDMDRMHEAGVKAFPAKTAGKGNQVLKPKIVGGVKVFDIVVDTVQWEVEPGKRVEAWTYNGVVPGPQIRVREGDRVRINVTNRLKESTAVHFHGVELPNDQDGVPFITQPPIKPGQTYKYEFTAPNPGSHMYHSHHNAAKQVGMGLLGAFIIEPKQRRPIEEVDVDYVMILNDGYHGFTLNGKSFPATEPIVAKLGQKLRIRYMNEGMMIHPMHLHGMHMTVIDKDGWPLPAPFRCDTLNIAPGERWDVIVNCTNPGTWAFHCHILPHAESEHGMFGMVTALVVQK